jgi:glycosyltransferase involved in cell wall biosynthesis/O-antigen/teichoic acid export membrane protein
MSRLDSAVPPAVNARPFSISTIFSRILQSETSWQTGLLFIAQLLSSLLNAFVSGLFARLLGQQDYGLFLFCWFSIIHFLSIFFEFGFFAASSRLLAVTTEVAKVKARLGAMLILALILGGSFSLTIAATAFVFQPLVTGLTTFAAINPEMLANRQVKQLLLLCSPFCLVFPWQLFLEQACQGLNRIRTLVAFRLLPPITIFLLLGILTWVKEPITVTNTLLISLAGYLLCNVVITFLLQPRFDNLSGNLQLVFAETYRFGLDIYLGRITIMISTKFDGLVIPFLQGTTLFSFYSIAQKLCDPLVNLSRSMAIARFKTFANEPTIRRKIIELNLLLLSSGTLAIILLGKFVVLLIFGEKYRAATDLLLPFALTAFLLGLFQPYNSFLLAHGRGGELRNISWAISAINILSLLLIVPRFGIYGAAWMSTFAASCNFSLHYYYYYQVYQQQVQSRPRRVTIVALSHNLDVARDWLRQHYGQIDVQILHKEELRGRTQLSTIWQLREAERDTFLIYCDRLEWQTRQTPMLLFGLVIGAAECILLDTQLHHYRRSRWQVVLRALPHLAVELIGSLLVVAISWLLTSLLAIWVKRPMANNHPTLTKSLTTIDNSPANINSINNIVGNTPNSVPSPLRITFIRTTPTSGAQTGGSNTHITGFTKGVLALGHQLNFISNDAISGINKEKTPITIIPPSTFFNAHRMIFELWNNLVFTYHARKLVAASPPDFIYQRYSRFSWAGVVISRLTGVPLVLEFNGSEVWVGRHWDDVSLLWLLERFEMVNLWGAQQIFVVSEVEKKNLTQAKFPADKIHVNPNGVDPEMFHPQIGGSELRQQLHLADKIVVGFVGTFGPWHGVTALAQAIVQLPRHLPYHFLLVGEGSLKPEVEKIIEQHQCQDLVTFTGRLSHRLVPVYLDACDILVSPHVPMADGSAFFGSPTKLFEYMAMAKAIVASELGQIGDVITHRKNGYLVEAGNIEMLVAALIEIADQPALRQQLGEQARLTAEKNYTWQQNANRVLTAFVREFRSNRPGTPI